MRHARRACHRPRRCVAFGGTRQTFKVYTYDPSKMRAFFAGIELKDFASISFTC